MDETFETRLSAIIEMSLDEQAQRRAIAGVADLEKKIQGTGGAAAIAQREMRRMTDAAHALREASQALGAASAAIAAPMIFAMRQYLADASRLDPTNQRWVASMASIEKSQSRIGRELTTAVVPALEDAARLMERAAKIAEDNPQLVQIAAWVAGGGLALAGGAGIASQVARFIAWAGLAGPVAVAAPPLAVAAATFGGAIYGGHEVARMGYNALGAPMGDFNSVERRSWQALANTFQHPEWGPLYRPPQPGPPRPGWGNVAGPEAPPWLWAGAGQPWAQGEKSTASSPQIALATQYRATELEADKAHLQQRAQINKSAADRMVQIDLQAGAQREQATRAYSQAAGRALEDYDRGRLQQAQDFARQEGESLAEYYAGRMQRAAAFGVDMGRMEEDFQRSRVRAQEDLSLQVKDLADQRDGLGILRAQRAFELERRRAEEDHATNVGRRNEDYATQLRDEEVQFAAQRDLRQKEFERARVQEADDFARTRDRAAQDFQQQLSDISAQAAREKAQVDRDKGDQLTALDNAHIEQAKKRGEQFAAQLVLLDQFGKDEFTMRARIFELLGRQYVEWAKSIGMDVALPSDTRTYGIPGGSGYAAGGYVDHTGVAWMHAHEFVMNQRTTRMAEDFVGGRLSDNVIMGALAAGRGGAGGGGASIHLRQEFTFNGSLSDRERDEYRRIARDETTQALDEAADALLARIR